MDTSISRRRALVALVAMAASRALAVTSSRIRVIGLVLGGTPESHGHYANAFHEGLKEAGLIEGRDVRVETRFAYADNERLKATVREIVAMQPAVIVTGGSPAIAALQRATNTIPVVFATASDPVAQGFVASLSRPGGNITGIAFNDDMSQKIYEVARTIVPRAARMSVLVDRSNPAQEPQLHDVPRAEQVLGFKANLVEASTPAELADALSAIARLGAPLIVPNLIFFSSNGRRIAQAALAARIPAFSPIERFADDGGVATYNTPISESYRQCAGIVARILTGSHPRDLPVQIPTKYALILNLRTAKALDLTIPVEMRMRADRVIE